MVLFSSRKMRLVISTNTKLDKLRSGIICRAVFLGWVFALLINFRLILCCCCCFRRGSHLCRSETHSQCLETLRGFLRYCFLKFRLDHYHYLHPDFFGNFFIMILDVRFSLYLRKKIGAVGNNACILTMEHFSVLKHFFQTAVVSILMYGCTTWTLIKRMEKKLDGNYTRMLRAILNKSWKQHPIKQLLYGHLPPITKTIQVWRTRHAGHCWRSRDELISDVLL